MMKRSLALGALMAFVITGSAIAAELTINYDTDNGDYNVAGTEISGSLADVYSSLNDIDMAGEMKPYVTKKNSNKTK